MAEFMESIVEGGITKHEDVRYTNIPQRLYFTSLARV